MKYEIQFARITNAGKLHDRFLNCQYIKPEELSKSSMGENFTLIEILSPWFASAQIGQSIVKNFSSQYFEGGSTSDLVNFENSLKKVNEHLAQITQNGETDWIGNLNGILATIVDNNIHISPTGRVEAYIFREGKVNHLTHGLGEIKEVHPLKTFSNIVSGQLKAHDKILIANKNLFSHLSIESLRQIITLNHPSIAASQITKLLRKNKARNTNLIIIDLNLRDEVSSEPINQPAKSVFYLDKSSESIFGKVSEFCQTILAPISRIVASKTGRTISNLFKKTSSKIKPARQRQAMAGGPARQPDLAKPQSEKDQEKPADQFHREFLSQDRRDDLLKDEEIEYSPELYVHYYKERKIQKENKVKNLLSFLLNKIGNLFKFLNAMWHDKARRKFLYIGFAALCIIIIGLYIGFKGNNDKIGNLEAQKILDKAIAIQKDGKSELSSGNQEKAKEYFIKSIETAQGIVEISQVKNDAEIVISNSYKELDKLTSTTRFDQLEPIVTLNTTNNSKEFFIISGEAIIFNDNEIYKANLLGGKPQKVATLPKNKGNFVSGTVMGKTLYLYTSNQFLYEFNASSEKLELVKADTEDTWETANEISNFVGSIYLLDGVLGQIYKHSSSRETFSEGDEYTTNNKILKDSLSLAIDGSIYVLKNDGEVIQLQRSKLQDFSLENIPAPNDKITDPKKIYTDSDTPTLYILDSGQKRILEFDKQGFFIRQYVLPESFKNISDFYVSVKSKKIWVLNENSLYEISI